MIGCVDCTVDLAGAFGGGDVECLPSRFQKVQTTVLYTSTGSVRPVDVSLKDLPCRNSFLWQLLQVK
jgi:hypothetical protein